jgi:E3 ubiquitin-protein ligase makorin
MHPPDLGLDDEGNDIYEMDEECCICLEKVLDNGRQFGVLENCDHTFCLKCIRGWRSTYDKRTTKNHFRTCPICRRNSYLVIPSSYLVKSGPEKTSLVEEYKEVLKEIPCRLFNKGKGECPFMNSCNYSHRLPDGTVYEYPWKDVKLNEMGEWEDDHELTLAERFGNFTI